MREFEEVLRYIQPENVELVKEVLRREKKVQSHEGYSQILDFLELTGQEATLIYSKDIAIHLEQQLSTAASVKDKVEALKEYMVSRAQAYRPDMVPTPVTNSIFRRKMELDITGLLQPNEKVTKSQKSASDLSLGDRILYNQR